MSLYAILNFNQLPKQDDNHVVYGKQFVKKEYLDINISDEAIIHNRQSMYKSDIRSMINFLQLNQNFQI